MSLLKTVILALSRQLHFINWSYKKIYDAKIFNSSFGVICSYNLNLKFFAVHHKNIDKLRIFIS